MEGVLAVVVVVVVVGGVGVGGGGVAVDCVVGGDAAVLGWPGCR